MIFYQKYRWSKLIFIIQFIFEKTPRVSFIQKLFLVAKFYIISKSIDCPHSNTEMLLFARAVFFLPQAIDGVLVEAGAYKGGSTAKLSLIAQIVGRKLIVFDSFQGLPANKEVQSYTEEIMSHQSFKDNLFVFPEGKYKGTLLEVKKNIKKYGAIDACSFKKGWFEDTMPKFHEKIAAMFLDVDLASSTRTCLKYLYPLLQTGGILMSHDGHLTLAAQVYKDRNFWKNEVGVNKPDITKSIKGKIIFIVKPNR